MPLFHAIVLGIAQGFAEFLPISSSGHLELVPWLFGWDDFNGDRELENAFDVALHVGTLVGAIAYLWSDVLRLARAGLGVAFRRRAADRDSRTAWLLVLSAAPAAGAGLLLEDLLLRLSDEVWLIALLLIVFALLLLYADRIPAAGSEGSGRFEVEFAARDAMIMGGAQAIALLPGVSRSGVTITAGRSLGFDRNATARIAFLMSLPLILGAGLYRGVGVMTDGFPPGFLGAFVAGMMAAAVTGWVAVWGTLRFVRSRSFAPFVAYRLVVGVGVLLLIAGGFRS